MRKKRKDPWLNYKPSLDNRITVHYTATHKETGEKREDRFDCNWPKGADGLLEFVQGHYPDETIVINERRRWL